MGLFDLHSFLDFVEVSGQLLRISAAVDPHLELATIVDRLCKGSAGGRAVLFEKVSGSSLPVAANLYGTGQRAVWALGATNIEELAEKFDNDLQGSGLANPEAALRAVCAASVHKPELTAEPPCREVDWTRQGLSVLPRVQAWPGDGGPYLTLAQVITRGLEDRIQNCGMYRVQLLDRNRAAVRCLPGSGMAAHLAEWQAAGKAMPVVIVLGGPPVLTWAASAPLPQGIDELTFCGYLAGQRLALTCCNESDLMVPATAEIVLEGEVAPGALAEEGPFGNHTGHYDRGGKAPLLTVRRVTARSNAIMPWTLVGPPPMENIQLARMSERLFLPLVRMAVPTVRDILMPPQGIFHRAALVAVDAAERRALPELARALGETCLLRGARLMVLCADDCDLRDTQGIYWRCLNRVDWERDLLHIDGRLVVDARHLQPGGVVSHDPAVLARVLNRWPELGPGSGDP